MKRFLLVACALAGCTKSTGPDAATIQRLEERVAALEARGGDGPATTTVQPGAPGTIAERLARLEAVIGRYSDALEFLGKVYDQQKAQAKAEEESEPDPDAVFAVDVASAVKAGQVEGPAGAPVTIIKAFDFACPYCYRLSAPLHELVGEYKGKLRVVYMNMVVHPKVAQLAHQYSCAAAKQRKYIAWKTAFWSKGFEPYAQSSGQDTSSMEEDNLVRLSTEVGLDVRRLKADAASPACKQRIEQDEAELHKFHVSGTPTLFINGTMISGALPKEALKQIIDDKLAKVAASGVPAAQYYDKQVMAKGLRTFRSKADAKK